MVSRSGLQFRRDRQRLRLVPEIALRTAGLRFVLLLSLQSAMASKSNVRRGQSATIAILRAQLLPELQPKWFSTQWVSRSKYIYLINCLSYFRSADKKEQNLQCLPSPKLVVAGDGDIKPCPRCQVLIVKMDDGSCNHMTCAVCGAEFCWLCMKEISDLHYLRWLYVPIIALRKFIKVKDEFHACDISWSFCFAVLLAALFGEKSPGPERRRSSGNSELW